jgi:hypothetical protein
MSKVTETSLTKSKHIFGHLPSQDSTSATSATLSVLSRSYVLICYPHLLEVKEGTARGVEIDILDKKSESRGT